MFKGRRSSFHGSANEQDRPKSEHSKPKLSKEEKKQAAKEKKLAAKEKKLAVKEEKRAEKEKLKQEKLSKANTQTSAVAEKKPKELLTSAPASTEKRPRKVSFEPMTAMKDSMTAMKDSVNAVKEKAKKVMGSSVSKKRRASKIEASLWVLAGAKPESFEKSIVDLPEYDAEKKLHEHLDALREKLKKYENVQTQSRNQVLKCKVCGKANGLTLKFCNNCGNELNPEEDRTETDNVMYAFVFGAKFPISRRFQSKTALVYDDLLCLSRCHINSINTETYITDIRQLFSNPEKGLKVIQDLYENAKRVIVEQFMKNEAFMEIYPKSFKDADEFLQKYAIFGFNSPPSQYLLHLQVMLLPLIPVEYFNYEQGIHYTKGRFFPYEYVKKALEKKNKIDFDFDLKPEVIIKKFKGYDKIYNKVYSKVKKVHKELNAWKEEDFEGKINMTTKEFRAHNEGAGEKSEGTIKKDKDILKNYGRGKLGYYKYAREEPMEEF